MSDQWETYPCQMGELPAFITYDHGVAEELEALPFPNLVCFRIPLDQPDDRGLPVGDEFDRLNTLEDALIAGFAPDHGLTVGRMTTDGMRLVYCYASLDEAAAVALARRVGAEHRYQIAVRHEADPERTGYWNELFPTEDDWRVIQDMRVQRALQGEGDPLTTPREIDHWAYFPSEEERQRFVDAVRSEFTEVEHLTGEDSPDASFGVRLRHVGLPDYVSMNPVTLGLDRAARAHGGNYDGWETRVCRE